MPPPSSSPAATYAVNYIGVAGGTLGIHTHRVPLLRERRGGGSGPSTPRFTTKRGAEVVVEDEETDLRARMNALPPPRGPFATMRELKQQQRDQPARARPPGAARSDVAEPWRRPPKNDIETIAPATRSTVRSFRGHLIRPVEKPGLAMDVIRKQTRTPAPEFMMVGEPAPVAALAEDELEALEREHAGAMRSGGMKARPPSARRSATVVRRAVSATPQAGDAVKPLPRPRSAMERRARDEVRASLGGLGERTNAAITVRSMPVVHLRPRTAPTPSRRDVREANRAAQDVLDRIDARRRPPVAPRQEPRRPATSQAMVRPPPRPPSSPLSRSTTPGDTAPETTDTAGDEDNDGEEEEEEEEEDADEADEYSPAGARPASATAVVDAAPADAARDSVVVEPYLQYLAMRQHMRELGDAPDPGRRIRFDEE